MHIVAIALLLVVLYPVAAAAQTCYGRADLTGERPIQIGAEFSHSDIVTSKGGSLYGGNSSIFGKVQVRHDNYHGRVTTNATVLDLGGGFQLAADTERRLVVCPEISLTRHFSSGEITETGSNLGISAKVIGGSVSAGFVLVNRRLQVVPHAGIWIQRFWPDDENLTSSRTVGSVRLGAGLVLSRRVSIVPGVGIPFRSPESESYFSLGLNFSLGE